MNLLEAVSTSKCFIMEDLAFTSRLWPALEGRIQYRPLSCTAFHFRRRASRVSLTSPLRNYHEDLPQTPHGASLSSSVIVQGVATAAHFAISSTSHGVVLAVRYITTRRILKACPDQAMADADTWLSGRVSPRGNIWRNTRY
jgi:hypothetical protein